MRLEAFRGRWTLARAIEDVREGRTGRFEGEAAFTPQPDGLAYLEEGTMTLESTGSFAAHRRYLWAGGEAGIIEVRFADGRFFHRILADEARPVAVHDCGADQYRVRYDFRRWPRWRTEWRVTGPAKDYGMVSDYRPAGQAG
jgi:Family of unknown function (DUF6314)